MPRLITYPLTCWLTFFFSSLPSLIWPSKFTLSSHVCHAYGYPLPRYLLNVIDCGKITRASIVCKKWKRGARESLAHRRNLSFAGWKMDDDSTARLVSQAYNLRELDIPRSRWGCQITDSGLVKISLAKCVGNLTSISLWGFTGITDEGVVQLISRTKSLEHLNVGGTFITDETLFAIARSCPKLESIVLWGCRHVTGSGLVVLVDKCRKLKSMNVWGTRVPEYCFGNLLIRCPALQIKV